MRFLYKIRKKRQKNGRPGQGVISLFGILVLYRLLAHALIERSYGLFALLDAFAVGVAKQRTFNNAHGAKQYQCYGCHQSGAGVGVDRFLHKQKYCQSGQKHRRDVEPRRQYDRACADGEDIDLIKCHERYQYPEHHTYQSDECILEYEHAQAQNNRSGTCKPIEGRGYRAMPR